MAQSVDIAELIDRQGLGWFQVRIVLLGFLTLFLDGVDNQAIAYVAPALTAAWHLPRGAMGGVFSAGIVGVALSALVIGPLADAFGRKRSLIATILYFSALSLLIAQTEAIAAILGADRLSVLFVLRFLAGFGLGAVLPLTVVFVQEFAPKRHRAAMVTTMGCGYAIGAASGGVFASYLVPKFGWAAMFYVGAALPVLLAAALAVGAPESLRYLSLRRDSAARIAAILKRIGAEGSFAPDTQFTLRGEDRKKGARVGQLFSDGRAGMTAFLTFIFFMNLLALNFLNTWLPTLTSESGLPHDRALRAAAMLQFGGTFGIVIMGFLADRFGFLRVLPFAFAAGAVFMALIGSAGAEFYPVAALIFISGFCNIGAQINLSALTATLYPTDIRSTAVSWTHGMARIVSIASPLLGGYLLSRNFPLAAMYLLLAAPMVGGFLGMMMLRQLRSYARIGDRGANAALAKA